MTDEGIAIYNNITRNESAFGVSKQKCVFLDPLNDYEQGGFLYIESVVCTVINLLGAVTATTGNAIIILTFWKSDHLRSQSHLFLWSLAIADFVTGSIVQPFFGAYKIAYLSVGRVYATCVLRIIFETVAWFSAALSCSLFASITGERYLALHYHLRYHDVVTTRKIIIFVIYLFITTGTLSLLRFAAKNVVPFLYVNIFGLLYCLFVLLTCYWKIYKQVRRHFRQIRDQSVTLEANQSLDVQRYKKSVINMAYVAVLYMISYLPFTCVLFAYLCNGFTRNVEAAYDITRTMAFMPSSWNPFIYFWKMNELREAVKKVVRRDYYSTFTETIQL